MSESHDIITVAAGQIEAQLMNEADATLAALDQLIRRAADQRAELLVLPECAYPAYLLGSVASYRAGDHMTTDGFLDWLSQRAREHDLHIVSGYIEDTHDHLYNAAVLIDRHGKVLGKAFKRFLWHADHTWFEPGDSIATIDSELGRIGLLICAETRCPEILATLVADGAELIAMPTCWINGSRNPGQYANSQVEFLMEARAREFNVPIICADKSGWEQPGTGYVGQSRIYRADGSVAATAPPEGDAVVTARIVRRKPQRVWMSDSRRERLLSSEAAIQRSDQSDRSLTIAAAPTIVTDKPSDGAMGESLYAPMKCQGVALAMMNIAHEQTAEQMAMSARAFDIKVVGFPTRADVFDLGMAMVGCVPGQWAGSFAAARALALDGAEVLMFFDMPEDWPILRTRAVENRVFVVGANERNAIIIAPDGEILAQGSPREPKVITATINVSDAANKMVAPATDIFRERRPAIYRF